MPQNLVLSVIVNFFVLMVQSLEKKFHLFSAYQDHIEQFLLLLLYLDPNDACVLIFKNKNMR
jgi:hypothetical protein